MYLTDIYFYLQDLKIFFLTETLKTGLKNEKKKIKTLLENKNKN